MAVDVVGAAGVGTVDDGSGVDAVVAGVVIVVDDDIVAVVGVGEGGEDIVAADKEEDKEIETVEGEGDENV